MVFPVYTEGCLEKLISGKITSFILSPLKGKSWGIDSTLNIYSDLHAFSVSVNIYLFICTVLYEYYIEHSILMVRATTCSIMLYQQQLCKDSTAMGLPSGTDDGKWKAEEEKDMRRERERG